MSDYLVSALLSGYEPIDKGFMKQFFTKELNEAINYFKKDEDMYEELTRLTDWGGDFDELFERLLINLHVEQMIEFTKYVNENSSLSFKIRFSKARSNHFNKTLSELLPASTTQCFDGPCTV